MEQTGDTQSQGFSTEDQHQCKVEPYAGLHRQQDDGSNDGVKEEWQMMEKNDETPTWLLFVITMLECWQRSGNNGVSPLREKVRQGKTPIMLAAEKGLSTILIKMLSFVSFEETKDILQISDYYGRTTLHWAIRSDDMDTIRSIRECFTDKPEEWCQLLGCKDQNGCTALHIAVQTGNSSAISYLLHDLQEWQVLMILKVVSNDEQETAIHYATCKPECLEALMKSIVDPEYKFYLLQILNYMNKTVLHKAVEGLCQDSEWHESIEYIMSCLAPERKYDFLAIPNAFGSTALHIAIEKNDAKSAIELLEDSPMQCQLKLLEIKDHAGNTPMDLAQKQPDNESILLWLQCYRDDARKFVSEGEEQSCSDDQRASSMKEEENDLLLRLDCVDLNCIAVKWKFAEISEDNSKLRRENHEKAEEIQSLRQKFNVKEKLWKSEKTEMDEEIQGLWTHLNAKGSTVLKLQAELDDFKKLQSLSFAEMTNEIEKTASQRVTFQDYEQKMQKLQNDINEFKVQAAMMVERSANQEAERKEYEHRLSSPFAVYEARIVKLEKELERCQKRSKEMDVQVAQNTQSVRTLFRKIQEFEENGERRFAELWRSTIAKDKQVKKDIGFLRSKESSLQHQILELLRRTLGDDARLLSREVHE